MHTPSPAHSLALDPATAAQAASISKGQLYKLWRQGLGPKFVRIGADRRVLVDDLRAWLEGLRKAA